MLRARALLPLCASSHDQDGNPKEKRAAAEARLAGDRGAAVWSRRHPLRLRLSPGQYASAPTPTLPPPGTALITCVTSSGSLPRA